MNWTKLNFRNLLFSYIIIFFGIFHLGLPIFFDLIISLLLLYFIKQILTSFITTLLLIVIFFISGYFFSNEYIYFRPHEKFATSNLSYKPMVNTTMSMPYGDLVSMSIKQKDINKIIEPRNVEFITDKRGYRNKKSFKGADFVLIGDSFIVGNGSTQDVLVSEQLKKKTTFTFLNLG